MTKPSGPRRIAIGALLYESNSFAVGRTKMQNFLNRYCLEGQAVIDDLEATGTEISGCLQTLREFAAEPVPLLATNGGSGPIVTAACHNELRTRMLAALQSAGRLDGVFLALHGAMVAEDSDDVEGSLLEAVRRIVGPSVPVAITLDLHAHVTPAILQNADIIVGYKHYPHDDAPDVAAHCVRMLIQAVYSGSLPEMAMAKVAALFPPHRERTDGDDPLAAFNVNARAIEQSKRCLSVSYFPVTPWLDVPDLGFAAIAVAEDLDSARDAATEMASEAWNRRHDFEQPTTSIESAVRRTSTRMDQPTLFCDTSDSVGGGSTGDSVAVLPALLSAPALGPAVMMVVDPETVQQAISVGIGGRFTATLGNKIDTRRGAPISVEATVDLISDGAFRYEGGMLAGVEASMGPSVVLSAQHVRIVVCTYASYEWGAEQYSSMGVDVRAMKVVVVKNPMNYRLTYPFAVDAIILDTLGPATPNLRSLSWAKRARPFFPMDDDFGGDIAVHVKHLSRNLDPGTTGF